MSIPWKNWCRLCASPNGGVPILDPDGSDHFLSDKILKYMSISVSKDDKISSLLCSKCCDQLAAFDNFVHRCLQVQALFCALNDLEEENIADERLHLLRKEFLSTSIMSSRDKAGNGNLTLVDVKKKGVFGEAKKHPVTKAKKKGSCSKKLPTAKENCDARITQSLENSTTECRKSERLKGIADMKRAFGEDDQTFNDTLDSDFNEDSFQNLLDSDDNFQPMIRNSQNGFRIKTDLKPIENFCHTSDLKQVQLVEFSKDSKSEKFSNGDRTSIQKKGVVTKLQNNICSNDLDCDVLSSDVNGTSINSLSDTDINDFMCNDNNDNGDEAHSAEIENNNHSKEYKAIGGWKNGEKDKSEEPCKLIREQEELNELNEMFHGTGNDGCVGTDEWSMHETLDGNDENKQTKKQKDQCSFKCDQCDKSFHRKALLNVHLMSHMPKDQQPFVCCKCARRFHCETLLRNHERVHLPNEEKLVYPCEICDKKFSSRSAVTAHLKAIHFGERPFVCHLCGHSFSSKGILQDHITIHSDEEPWHCTKCTKKFKTKYRLRIHMDTHRETPYSCPHCPVQLSTRRTLRMHLVVHRDTKAYQCSTCGKAFRRAKDLKNHQNLHTGRRPYTCPFCSRTFANGSNCRSHKRRMHPEELRLYEAALAGNGGIEAVNNSTPVETNSTNSNNLIAHPDLDEEGNHSMKEDSQDSLLTEMALDLQQPQILTVKSSLDVHEDPEVTAADLTLAPLVTLSSTLPKLEPDDSRFVMNLTTQMHDTHDSMDAMSPLNLNIMSPMNLNISSPLNLNISSPLNLNISSVLHSPTGRNQQQQQHSVQSQHHQTSNRYQPLHHQHQPQQQPQHITMQPTQHQTHQQPQQHHQQLTHQTQLHQQIHQQQMPRSTIQISTLQTSLNSSSSIHTLAPQTQLPAHLNNVVHHNPQTQNFIPINQQGTLYTHHAAHTAHVQDSVSSAALVAAAAMAHSVATSSSTVLPPFGSNPYVQHSMSYGRSANM